MPSHERAASQDRELVLRYQSVPMWDSSDPERAPPPLPMNPGSPSTKPKSNVSPNIQAVAANFADKPRDNTPSPYTTNQMPPRPSSPEKSLIKGHYHKRLQSLQNTDTRSEFLDFLERKSPERPQLEPTQEHESKQQEKARGKLDESPLNMQDDKDFSNYLISNRYLSKPILGESTPTSATMLALQNMQIPPENESPSPSNPKSTSGPRAPKHHNFDSLASQIHSLTDIASNLQREMSQLSRRSKDNATDLLSLKAATSSRDEDIRRSLRDLSSSLSSRFLDNDGGTRGDSGFFLSSRDGINQREPDSSPSSKKSYSAPRVTSPNPFAATIDRELCGSPATVSDGSASIALLEKVLREMATKEGQDKLLELADKTSSRSVTDVSGKAADRSTTKMLEEILRLVKEDSGNKALVQSANVPQTKGVSHHETANVGRTDSRSLDLKQTDTYNLGVARGNNDQMVERSAMRPDSLVTEEMLSIMKRVGNSVMEGGGMTNEVKALVRELRGEVLGMGRNLARQLQEVGAPRSAVENRAIAPGKEDISVIIHGALQGLREQLASVVAENRQHSTALSEFRAAMSSAEIYSIIKKALDDFGPPQPHSDESRDVGLRRDEILETVREAWETYKPEIELSNFGLDREEILECLTEGLKTYQPQHEQAATYDQVLAAVQAGMQNFDQPPSITKDEIVQTIRDCFEIQQPNLARYIQEEHLGPIRDEILQAVTQGIASQSTLTRETLDSGLGRDEILSAVSDGVEAHFTTAKGMEQSHVTKEVVTNAINDAFAAQSSAFATHAQPPASREEILSAIAEGLENQSGMGREIELNKDDLMDAIVSGLHEATSSASFSLGEPVIEHLQGLLDGMKEEFKQYSAAGGKDTEQVLDAVKDGFDDVRKEMESYVTTASGASGKYEIMDTVKEGFRLLQADMEKTITENAMSNASRGNLDTPQLLDAMDKEFEHLRQTLSSLLIHNNTSSEKEEILDAIHDIADSQKSAADSGKIVDAIKEELEHFRQSMGIGLVGAEPRSDKEEIIAALRENLETFREEGSHQRGGDESTLFATSELLDSFNDGIGTIREDLAKLLDKPSGIDSAEDFERIKEGLNGLKADVELLRKSRNGSDEPGTARDAEVVLSDESNPRSGIDGLRTLITQLHTKLESLEAARGAEPSHDVLKREHLDEVLVGLQDIQSSISGGGTRDTPVDETAARKEDTDAIETIVRNTKAQLDELAKEEHLTAVQEVVKETKDSIADLSARFEADGPTKSEIGTLEALLRDMWIAFDEMKGKGEPNEEDAEKLGKSDLRTVEGMIFEVKAQIDELKLPDVETLPTKTEIQELSALVTDFREKVEAEHEMTGQGFEARKVEHGGIADKIDEAKTIVRNIGDELKSKLDGSNGGLTELRQLLEGLAASTESFTTVENVKDLTELINREFERTRGEQDASKLEKEEQHAAAINKQDEYRAAIIVELGSKIDEKFGEVIAKYDEAKAAMSSRFSETEERDNANLEAVTSATAIAEDIKFVIGEMGNTMNETCERISVDTQTFFEKVGESYNKMEEMQTEVKSHQEQSRTDLEKTAAATGRVESKLQEFHPQILESVKEILSVVGRHYDHSQNSARELQAGLSALPSSIPSLLPALPTHEQAKYDDSQVHEKLDDLLGHAKSNQIQEGLNTLLERVTNDKVHEKLEQLLSHSTSSNAQVYEKLDELIKHSTGTSGPVHEKLDTLLESATNSDQSVTQMMKLDEMHKDIMESSRRMNEMHSAQSSRLEEEDERRRKESEEVAITLERRKAQREQVEAEVADLNEEKDSLLKAIQHLKSENEDMVKQNAKLSKDLSGLEMALDLRHEEMQVMEERADSLEKRILEGVLDHARTVLLSRPNSQQAMNLKRSGTPRARKTSGTSTASTAKDQQCNILGSGVGMALKRRAPASPQLGSTTPSNTGNERRILSMSHVTGNRGPGPRQVSGNSGLTGMKRSHSVRTNFSQRKASWGGGRSSIANKENEAFPEEEEMQSGDESDTATERRTSYTGTYTDSMVYGTASAVSVDRRSSFGSSTNGLVAGTHSVLDESIAGDEQDDGERREEDHASVCEEDDPTTRADDADDRKLVVYGYGDSGLGAEVTSGA